MYNIEDKKQRIAKKVRPHWQKGESKLSEKTKEILEWVYCIVIALVLAMLFRYFIGTPTIVKMTSMYPTLVQDERLWLNRWGRTTKTMPKRGEIITFEEPAKVTYSASEIDQKNPVATYKEKNAWQWFVNDFLEIGKRSYIKRVIALPGEHVEIRNGKVYINGEALEEPYLQPGVVTDSEGFDNFVVPENYIFAIGDNRNHSTDCRAFGCIPLEEVESTVAIRIWPLNKWGKV